MFITFLSCWTFLEKKQSFCPDGARLVIAVLESCLDTADVRAAISSCSHGWTTHSLQQPWSPVFRARSIRPFKSKIAQMYVSIMLVHLVQKPAQGLCPALLGFLLFSLHNTRLGSSGCSYDALSCCNRLLQGTHSA